MQDVKAPDPQLAEKLRAFYERQKKVDDLIARNGADIRNIVNEAALWAARHNKTKVEPEDFEYAMDKIQMGAKRGKVVIEP